MSVDEITTLWRGLNATLAFGAFFMVLFLGVRPKFRKVDPETQGMMVVTLMLLFTATWGSIEQAMQEVPLGLRVPITTSTLILTWYVMLRNRKDG